MKFAVALSFVSLAVAAAVEPRHCAGNNCNRAVTGTRPGLLPLTERSAHCSSFLLTTVTPAPSTITVTIDDEDLPTPTADEGCDAVDDGPVTVTPTHIPDYAENCANVAEYISACSCFGLTGSVTTAPAPTVTETTTLEYCDAI